ncbi:unnamed protein product [Cylindrotheca closterium]|uniref:Uncharacterized protein n=1 Tax=Cylindrotheca closterium TaxID=2856 RepID=A0AAD2JJV2_9STRA|nr:unnamed protein product [Cylindrotheca closterium]
MAAVPPFFTVHDDMVICGIDDVTLFQGRTQAERIAYEIFSDDFTTTMDSTIDELNEEFKTLAGLTIAQGQIRLMPAIKKNIRAFIQWCRDEVRMGRDPSTTPFPVVDAAKLLRRMKTHEQYVYGSKLMSQQALPQDFTNDVQWEDWCPTFENYLRTIPGRDGVPLSYIVRMNDAGTLTLHEDFLETYVNMAPHVGEAYVMDNAKVLVLLSKFIVGNTEAETILQAINIAGNGREAFNALRTHYEGEGILASDIVEAEHTIKELCYVGEKQKMNWSMFERMLKKAYATCDKHEGREVHSDAMKLRSLQNKVTAPFLQLNKTAIDTEIGKRPMLMTFTTALRIYRTAVREKFPQGTSNATDRGRYLGETRADNDRDRSRSRNDGGGNKRRDEEEITLSNGEKIWYHPSYRFSRAHLQAFTNKQRERMAKERAAYRESQGLPARRATARATQTQQVETQLAELRAEVASIRSNNVPATIPAEAATQISQVTMGTTGTTAMGGRNQQANNQQASGRT